MLKIILFGDSIFNGYSAGKDTDCILQGVQESFPTNIISNLSLSGATTVQGLQRLNLISADADLVVLEYGTNDMATTWGISSTDYAKNINKMIKTIGAKRMIIVGPSYPNPNNKGIMQYYPASNIRLFNYIAQANAAKYDIPFVDLVAHFRNLKNISSYYQEDGQHLTVKGNRLLIKLLITAIKQKLAQ